MESLIIYEIFLVFDLIIAYSSLTLKYFFKILCPFLATHAQTVSIIRNSNENFVESIQALREGWKRFQPVAVKK